MKGTLYSLLLLLWAVTALGAHTTSLRYSGSFRDQPKTVAPSFSNNGFTCANGTNGPTEHISFSFDVEKSNTAYFIRVLLSDDIKTRGVLKVSSEAPTDACTNVIRGASSSTTAPHIQFVQWIETSGTYHISLHLASALGEEETGLFAISVTEATAYADTAESQTYWKAPYDDAGACEEAEHSPYAHSTWTPSADGYYDVNVILENIHDDSVKSTLAVWECASSTDLPGNGFSKDTIFDTCASNDINNCLIHAIRQASLSFGTEDMHVSYGSSSLAPRLYMQTSKTYYIMYSSESMSKANQTGKVALIVEPTRFGILQDENKFTSPAPNEQNCTSNIADQANALFYFPKEEDENVVIIEVGATDFDAIGSFYLGVNSNRETCPTNWLTTVDLEGHPVSIVASVDEYNGVTVIVSPFSGTGAAGWYVQLWAMTGPSLPIPPSPSPSPTPSPSPSDEPPVATPSVASLSTPSILAIMLGLGATILLFC